MGSYAVSALVTFAVLLTGCANRNPTVASTVTTLTSSFTADACTYEGEHLDALGNMMQAGYYCTVFLRTGYSGQTPTSSNVVGTSGCSFVAMYTRKDGASVGPYIRCKKSADATLYKSAASAVAAEPAPCVTSYCGPVHVNGYYRKDGTYVRPHSRKK